MESIAFVKDGSESFYVAYDSSTGLTHIKRINSDTLVE